MREVMQYIANLHRTITAQNKGIRRLVRKNKRLQQENAILRDELTEMQREIGV